jgi:hypothetical protein
MQERFGPLESEGDSEPSAAINPIRSTSRDSDERKSQASRLVDMGKQWELFHTPEGVAYACLTVNGHRETWRTSSRAFRETLVRAYLQQFAKVPNAQAIRDGITTLDAIARIDGPEQEVYIRVAGDGQHIWLDLGNSEWEAVEITAEGWQVVAHPPVHFRRSAGMLPLPYPAQGGSVTDLKNFINIDDVNAWVLIVSWCVTALRPQGPYPILYLVGEQGSAKSTATRVIRSLVDPCKPPIRSMPRSDRDLFIAANNNRVIAFDNVSHIDAWLSDALCCLATGGGFATRSLYTDSDEIIST